MTPANLPEFLALGAIALVAAWSFVFLGGE